LGDDGKTELVKSALRWIVGDVGYLQHATGLFAKELNEMNRLRRRMRGNRDNALNTTADIASKRYSDFFYSSVDQETEFEVKIVADIQAQQARLEALSVAELETEVMALVQSNKNQKEAQRPFNRDTNQLSRLSFWVRKSVWSPQEALLIFGGREPTNEVVRYLEKMGDYEREESPFASAYFMTLELMETAISVGEISSPGRPLEYLHWYEKMLADVDDELRKAILEIHDRDQSVARTLGANESGEELSDLEQKSLLKIVAAMAINGYRFDPKAQRNQATSDIQSDAHLLGLELDPKTILKWLRKACELLPDDPP